MIGNHEKQKRPGPFGMPGRIACLMLAALALGNCAFALDVPIAYKEYGELSSQYHPYGSISLEKATQAPPGDWVLPKLFSDTPVYCLYKLGDQKCLLVLDKKAKASGFYDRIYFDADGDRNLTNDPWFEANTIRPRQSNYSMADFPAITTTVTVGGKSLPFSFRPYVYCFFSQKDKPITDKSNWSNFHVSCRIHCAYEGILRYKGKSYSMLLNDRNVNGLFGDSLSIQKVSRPSGPQVLYGQGDMIYIQSGKEKISYYSGLHMGQFLVLGDALFSIQVKTAESKLTLTPVKENLVSVALPAGVDRLMLHDEGGKQNIMMYKPGASVKLPAGKYLPQSYSLQVQDDQKDGWQLIAMATSETPFVTVAAGKENRIAFGEPFTPVVDIEEWSKRNFVKGTTKSVTLGFNVEGSAGERVTYLAHVSGMKTKIKLSQSSRSYPLEPEYKIITSQGELAGDGSFEYG